MLSDAFAQREYIRAGFPLANLLLLAMLVSVCEYNTNAQTRFA
jgi:hypothetical protein